MDRAGALQPTGSNGFPGKVTAAVTYTLNGNNVHIAFEATTCRTVVNMTNYTLFDLAVTAAALTPISPSTPDVLSSRR